MKSLATEDYKYSWLSRAFILAVEMLKAINSVRYEAGSKETLHYDSVAMFSTKTSFQAVYQACGTCE
jgi:hypothetical protein